MLLALAASIWLLKKKGVADVLFLSESSKYEKELFIIGSSVFISTFLLARNWDYRLIFLLLCLPYILSFKDKLVLHATAVCVLLSMNVLAMNAIGRFTMIFTEISKYYLFVAFSLALGYELLRHDES